MKEYKDLVNKAKFSPTYMQQLLNTMDPLIKAYAKKLFFLDWDDAVQEMSLSIIEAVNIISICMDDSQCLKFINNAVKFKFASLCKKNLRKEKFECTNMDSFNEPYYIDDYSSIEMICDLKQNTLKMTPNQKNILKYLILGYSDSEIASLLKLSRQYINREKKKLYNL